MRKRWVTMACLLIAAVLVAQGNAAEPLTPLTIQLNWIPNVQFAGVLLAKERGWYEEAGIDLTIKAWEVGISPIDDVITGKAQIGVVEGDVLISARTKGATMKAIGVQFQKSAFCLLSKKDQGITTLEQLRGKRIGIPIPDEALIVKIMLKDQGLPFEEIIPVGVGWDLQPLIDDKIDALVGFMNDQPLFLKEKGYDVTYIPAFKHGYDFYSGVYFVDEKTLQEQPKLITPFLKVTLRGWKEAFQDPEATAKLIVEKFAPNESLSQQIESLKLFRTLGTLGEGKKFLGWMDEGFWQKGINILSDFQQIDKKIPAKDVFTMEFLDNLYFGKKE